MELIYNVTRPSGVQEPVKEDDIMCRLSLKNTIAFTSSVSLNPDKKDDSVSAVGYVYVCDVDKPWEIYQVSSFKSKVKCLEWHDNSFQLLIITEGGLCEVFEMKNYLMNCWVRVHKAKINGETFIAVNWFNQGVKIYLNGDKKESASFSEKIVRERQAVALSHYGGKVTDGWIGVTSTGLVCVGLLSSGVEDIHVQKETLGSCRQRFLIADLTQEKNGDILLLASTTHISQPLSCYTITLTPQQESCSIRVKPTANLYIRSVNSEPKSSLDGKDEMRVIGVKFLSSEGGSVSALVVMGNSVCSQVDKWVLKPHVMPLRRFFQQQPTDSKNFMYQWSLSTSVNHPSLPVSIALSNLPIKYTSHEQTKFFQYIAVAYKDGSIKIINRHTLQSVATSNLDMGFNDTDKPEKRKRVVPCIVTMMQTFTGCGLIGIDQLGCVYMMKVVNTRDTLTQVHPSYLVSILEYLLVSGIDWWDVLISLKPGMIENVIQRLSDNFAKQPAVMQDILFERHMAVKASLYGCSTGGQQRAADCHCKLLLHAISSHFKSQLRPKGLSAQDMGPVEKLTHICSKNPELDIDKVMVSLNPEKKEFVVDEATIQATQPLIQWVVDLVLYLLTSLPTAQGYGGSFPGYSILHDSASLGLLRELLVVIRIWGLINRQCLPHFTTTTTNLDPMLEMFKILTRVWQTAKENKGFDFDEALIDKCCLLPSQVYVPNNEQALFGNAYTVSSSIVTQNHPIKCSFNDTPFHVSTASNSSGVPKQKVDMVHLMNLGVDPAWPCKCCSRCGNLCLLEPVFPVVLPVVQAWEGKWLKACLCGGMWKKQTVAGK